MHSGSRLSKLPVLDWRFTAILKIPPILEDREEISQALDQPPYLLVVVDTEEEFDWNKSFDPDATSVEAMSDLPVGQAVCDEFEIRPTYVIDYPVASNPMSVRVLQEIITDDRAALGAHLHPWVNPPVDEEITGPNSYAGNLPRKLEAEKLRRLGERIEESFDLKPNIYKAGRYGLGGNSAAILEELGYEVDLSACPPYDFRIEGGPDYSRFSCHPFWFGKARRLLGLPNTGSLVGFLGSEAGRPVYDFASQASLRWTKLPGILSRLRVVDRLRLSPEGFELKDLMRLTDCLIERGVRTFSFSFHSPSLRAGCTPYVRSHSDLDRFIGRCRDYFEYFLGAKGGQAVTPIELKNHLDSNGARQT